MTYLQKVCIIAIYAFIVSYVTIPSARADIYVYVDKNKVRHFTNVPTSSKYRLYLKSNPHNFDKIASDVRFSYNSNRYDHLILKASIHHDVDFSLLKSIIKVESNFDNQAVSHKGAMGLMQIMPQNFSFLNIRNPFDPEENIMGGTLYFKQLMEKFNKLELALAAYNAGPGTVDRYNGIPPIPETKGYVNKVLAHYKNKSY